MNVTLEHVAALALQVAELHQQRDAALTRAIKAEERVKELEAAIDAA